MVKIFIDPGHGGTDTGASGGGLKEKDVTLKIAKKVRDILKDDYNDPSIKMSRTSDETVSLSERTNMANKWGADYLLSIHINAGKGNGFESYIYNGRFNGKDKTDKLRKAIHKAVTDHADFSDRGKKEKNLHMLRESDMPASLTENGFIDQKGDVKLLKSGSFLKRIASGHAKGLADALGLKKKNKDSGDGSKSDKKFIEVVAESLWTYHTADWDDKADTVHKEDVFTIKRDKFPVGDGHMYQIKSGLYITASSDYVREYTS